MEKFDTVSHC